MFSFFNRMPTWLAAMSLGCIGCVEEEGQYQIEDNIHEVQLTSKDVESTFVTESDTEEAMPVPPELSDDPNDTDWIFDGYYQEPTEEEKAKRKEKYLYTQSLSDEEYELYKEQRRQEKLAARCLKAKIKKKKCDERDDLLVTILPNQQVWRLRGSKDSIPPPSKIEPSEGAPDMQYIRTEQAAGLPFFADVFETIFSTDISQSETYTKAGSLEHSGRSASNSQLILDVQFHGDENPEAQFNILGTDGRSRVYPTTGYPARTHGSFIAENANLTTNPIYTMCNRLSVNV